MTEIDNIEIDNIEIDLNAPIYVFWHIFIDGKGLSRGKNIINRQFNKIQTSGLLDKCDTLYIGYVSSFDFPFEHIINHPKVKILIKKEKGCEGVTTTVLKEFCDKQREESLIFIFTIEEYHVKKIAHQKTGH